jgi:hypothetical protein
VVWPAHSVVALAYLDQLTRSKAVKSDRAAAIKSALDRADRVHSPRDKAAPTVAEQLNTLADQLQQDAAGASGRDASRLRALASTLTGRGTSIRGAD